MQCQNGAKKWTLLSVAQWTEWTKNEWAKLNEYKLELSQIKEYKLDSSVTCCVYF